MRRTLALLLSSAALITLMTAAACVGDETNAGGPSPDDAGATVAEGSVVDDAGNIEGAAPDGGEDPLRCGSPAKDCLGGACMGGRCQPVIIADQLMRPDVISVDQEGIYWLNRGALLNGACDPVASSGSILSAKHDGSNVKVLAQGLTCPVDLTVFGSEVFFVTRGDGTNGRASKTSKAGGAITLLRDTLVNASSLTVNADDVYVAESGTPVGGRISILADGGATTLADGQPLPRNLISGGGNPGVVYWLTGGTGAGAIRQTSKTADGGPGVTLATSQVNVAALTRDNANLFWTMQGAAAAAGEGRVKTFNTAQGLEGELASGLDAPTGIAFDASHVYFATKTGQLKRVPRAGGVPEELATFPGNVTTVAVDATSIYVTLHTAGRIARLAK